MSVAPDITEKEFREMSDRALDEMRALGEPDEQVENAAAMLDSIARPARQDDLTQQEIDQLDAQFLEAASCRRVG